MCCVNWAKTSTPFNLLAAWAEGTRVAVIAQKIETAAHRWSSLPLLAVMFVCGFGAVDNMS